MPEVRRDVVYHVNMGNYEWVEIRAGVTVELDRGGSYPTAVAFAQEQLDKLVAADLAEARRLTAYGVDSDDESDKSFVEQWRQQ